MGLSHSTETSEDPEVLQGMSETRFDYWEGGEEPERADMDLNGKYTEEVNSHTRNRWTLNAVRKPLGDELSWASPLVQLISMIIF